MWAACAARLVSDLARCLTAHHPRRPARILLAVAVRDSPAATPRATSAHPKRTTHAQPRATDGCSAATTSRLVSACTSAPVRPRTTPPSLIRSATRLDPWSAPAASRVPRSSQPTSAHLHRRPGPRTGVVLDHHESCLTDLLGPAGDALTPWQLAERMEWNRPWADIPYGSWNIAVSEAEASSAQAGEVGAGGGGDRQRSGDVRGGLPERDGGDGRPVREGRESVGAVRQAVGARAVAARAIPSARRRIFAERRWSGCRRRRMVWAQGLSRAGTTAGGRRWRRTRLSAVRGSWSSARVGPVVRVRCWYGSGRTETFLAYPTNPGTGLHRDRVPAGAGRS